MKLEDADVPHLLFTEQASAPSTPATGKWKPFFKSDGLYIVDDAGAVTGPFESTSALTAHLSDTTDAHDASAISFTPAGTIAATDVQAAIEEVATEAGAGGAIRVEDEGSTIVAAATGVNFAGAGVTVTDAGSNEALVTIPDGWTLVVDESGASIANWTTVAGTWAADAGGYLKQTDTTDAYRGLRLTAAVHPGAGMVAQAEMRFPTSAKTLRRTMLAIGSTAAVGATTDIWAGIQEGTTDAVIHQRGDAGTLSEALTIAEDQWYTVRVSQFGNHTSVSVDGTMVSTTRGTPTVATNPVAADKFMLVNYSGEVHFRNIKVWRHDGPA